MSVTLDIYKSYIDGCKICGHMYVFMICKYLFSLPCEMLDLLSQSVLDPAVSGVCTIKSGSSLICKSIELQSMGASPRKLCFL